MTAFALTVALITTAHADGPSRAELASYASQQIVLRTYDREFTDYVVNAHYTDSGYTSTTSAVDRKVETYWVTKGGERIGALEFFDTVEPIKSNEIRTRRSKNLPIALAGGAAGAALIAGAVLGGPITLLTLGALVGGGAQYPWLISSQRSEPVHFVGREQALLHVVQYNDTLRAQLSLDESVADAYPDIKAE